MRNSLFLGFTSILTSTIVGTVIVPGAMITIAALAFNLAGDAIRDSLDPRLR
jgi:ABC-type dipeptide/oligopeptide/nickel transport system permease subunit